MTAESKRGEDYLRITIFDELNGKFESRINDYETEIEQLKNNLAKAQEQASCAKEMAEEARKKDTDILLLKRQMETQKGELESLGQRHQKLRKSAEEHRKELQELKTLNPKQLKKNLDKKKRDLKTKQETLKAKQEEVSKLNSAMRILKQENEQFKKVPDTPSDAYIYTSKCGDFRVFGVSFKSEERPFIGEDINYRVLNEKTGASFVGYLDNGFVKFGVDTQIPEDVIKFVHQTAAIEKDKPKETEAELV